MKKRSTKEILKQNLDRTSPLREHFILWLHDIRSLHNVGAAFRTAEAFGIHQLWLSGFTPTPPRPEITKTAIGAEDHVKWRKVQNIEKSAGDLQSRGYTIIGLEQTDRSSMLHEFELNTDKICLVLGNEVTGISESILPLIDRAVEIPQFGMKHSLNVSVAAGIALYAFLDKLYTQ